MPSILKRPSVLIPLALLFVAVVAAGLYLFQPWRLITDVTVDEALPVAAQSASASDAPSSSGASTAGDSPSEPAGAGPTTLLAGQLISHEHETTGTVSVIELEDGSRVLRIEELETSNGPDLKVWLAAAPVLEGTDGWFVFDDDDYVDLGSLKGNRGNQNYAIPADIDLDELTSVTIWCDRFSVSFGAAALTPPGSA